MNLVRKVISCVMAPKAIGPYSQAIFAAKTLYISGQLGINPETMEIAGPSVEQQTEQTLKNLSSIVKASGGQMKDIVKTTILLANMEDFATVNEIYAKYFTDPYPARVCYAVKALPKNALVGIEAIAVLDLQ
ncbi:RutC family protein C23G10.2 [Echinococcus granulosus]|nr:RutC family protein C23G10.2 [Echinococcus granulosus]